MNKQIKSNVMLLTAAIVWGFAFTTQCMLQEDALGEFAFNAVRYLLGGICLFPVIFLLEYEQRNIEKFKKTLIYGAVTGVILFLASAFQMAGLIITRSPAKGGFITGLYIVIVPFYNYILYKKKVKINEWIAAGIAILGSYFLSITNGFDNISMGDVVIVIGAFFWAAHIMAVDKFVEKVSPIKYSCVQFLACGLCNLIASSFTDKITISGIMVNWLPILYTGIMSTGVAYTCQILGQKGANPNSACIIMSLEGLFAAMGGMIFLNQSMTSRSYLGSALMLTGAILSQINIKGGNKVVTKGTDNAFERS